MAKAIIEIKDEFIFSFSKESRGSRDSREIPEFVRSFFIKNISNRFQICDENIYEKYDQRRYRPSNIDTEPLFLFEMQLTYRGKKLGGTGYTPIFTKDSKFIEDGIKRHYRREINPNGHEWIEGVCVQKIIDRVKNVLDEFCIDDYNIVSAETLKKYNDYVITTVKVDEEEDDEEEDDVVVVEEKSEEDDEEVVEEDEEEEDDEEVVEEKSEEEEDEDEVVEDVEEEDEEDDEEEDEDEDEEEEQEIEEKIDIMKEQLDEYKEILLHLESYTVKKMDEILRKIGSSLTGTKDIKIKKIKDKLEPIIHKKPLTKKCDTCNLEKTANDKHFRAFKNKLLRGTCKACEFKKCAPAPVKIKPLVHTEITRGMETLQCRMCHEDKSVNDFYKNKSRGTRGYDYNCKNCETLRKCGTYDVRECKKKPADIPVDCKWCPNHQYNCHLYNSILYFH